MASHLNNLPIISLRNGYVVARTGKPIVNQTKLEMVAVYCQTGGWRKTKAVIMARDIREVAREGLVIDSLEDIEDVEEIVRLKTVIEQRFEPIGVNVVTEAGSNLGKVEDFTLNVKTFQIQKLYVKQSLLKNLLLNNLVIDRAQITDVTSKQITVRDATVPKAGLAAHPVEG